MAENTPPPDERPTPPSGLPALPAGGSAPDLPPGLNADEYRRFQEFQRFQDYQRFVQSGQGHPQPGPPPGSPEPGHELATQLSDMRQQLARIERVTNPPMWQKVLRNKWLHRLVWLVILIALGTWGVPTLIHHYFGSDTANSGPAALPAPVNQSGTLPEGPHQAVQDIYMFIAENQTGPICHTIFDATAGNQFAASNSAANCPAAVTGLYGQLKNKEARSAYAQPDLTELPSPQGNTMRISSCEFTVSGGPRLGTFTLTHEQSGWRITGYAGPAPCPSSTSTPPTS